MQLCGFHCITWYSICILVIFPLYFYCFTTLPCETRGVHVVKMYQIRSDVDISSSYYQEWPVYKARHAHKRLYTVLPKYSKIQVLPGITSCRLVKDNKQAIELNSLLINNMPEGGYG